MTEGGFDFRRAIVVTPQLPPETTTTTTTSQPTLERRISKTRHARDLNQGTTFS